MYSFYQYHSIFLQLLLKHFSTKAKNMLGDPSTLYCKNYFYVCFCMWCRAGLLINKVKYTQYIGLIMWLVLCHMFPSLKWKNRSEDHGGRWLSIIQNYVLLKVNHWNYHVNTSSLLYNLLSHYSSRSVNTPVTG